MYITQSEWDSLDSVGKKQLMISKLGKFRAAITASIDRNVRNIKAKLSDRSHDALDSCAFFFERPMESGLYDAKSAMTPGWYPTELSRIGVTKRQWESAGTAAKFAWLKALGRTYLDASGSKESQDFVRDVLVGDVDSENSVDVAVCDFLCNVQTLMTLQGF